MPTARECLVDALAWHFREKARGFKMTCLEIIAAIKDVLVGLAAAVAAIVAVVGLTIWRRELKGKAEFGVARNLMRATYRLRDAVQDCRVPFITGGEFPSGYEHANTSSHEEAEAYGYMFKNRWTPVSEAVQEFDTQTLEAEAFWGAEIRSKTDILRQCVGELRAAIAAFVDDKKVGGRDFQADKEFGKKMRETVWAIPDPSNQLSQRIKGAIDAIETLIRPHLRRK